MQCSPPDDPQRPNTAAPDQAVWRELARLQQENEALRAALREYGIICQLAGREMVNRSEPSLPQTGA